MLKNLPAAYFSGVRVSYANADEAVVSIPFKWFTQNPFRSTYFACLSMAAEMSTGLLAMAHLYKAEPKISMLVTAVESRYFKKAVGKTHFRCIDGNALKEAIAKALTLGESLSFKAKSVGRNDDGEIVAEFEITWSFKTRNQRTS
jgi:hypothetical protein